MTNTAIIAASLGAFFLLVAAIKGILARADRRRIEDERSAALNGGTPEAPIHLGTPFAPNPESEASAEAQVSEEDRYVWE